MALVDVSESHTYVITTEFATIYFGRVRVESKFPTSLITAAAAIIGGGPAATVRASANAVSSCLLASICQWLERI